MGYTRDYILLKNALKSTAEKTPVPESNLIMKKHAFESENTKILPDDLAGNSDFQLSAFSDREIPENRKFEYPLIRSNSKQKESDLIIMLHGLNEKSWDKYWTWAKELSEKTNKAVLLFPLSFHMDRVPGLWADPRKMTTLMEFRKKKFPESSAMSFVNAALSERLSNMPERFVLSGYQSILDLVELVKSIKAGSHIDFKKDTHIDLFGYSIGAFLSQVLLITNPENLFSDSKFMLFGGGSVFSEINGTSRLIMDQQAFENLHYFYLHEKLWTSNSSNSFQELMSTDVYGNSFRAMLSPKTMRKLRERSFEDFHDRIKVISLKKDQVFPFKKIVSAFKKNMSSTVELFDTPFHYTHENPFPVSTKACVANVTDELFEKVFFRASKFLAS
ncbi:DUF6051 family protein [Bacteroidota bacterium]